jgi:hypothetical protein
MNGSQKMKRSEALLTLQRYYSIKHCMVEANYITKDQFMDEVLTLVEELGMRPPYDAFQDDEIDIMEWEPENGF